MALLKTNQRLEFFVCDIVICFGKWWIWGKRRCVKLHSVFVCWRGHLKSEKSIPVTLVRGLLHAGEGGGGVAGVWYFQTWAWGDMGVYTPSRTSIPPGKTGWGRHGNFFHVVKNFSEKLATFFFYSPQANYPPPPPAGGRYPPTEKTCPCLGTSVSGFWREIQKVLQPSAAVTGVTLTLFRPPVHVVHGECM